MHTHIVSSSLWIVKYQLSINNLLFFTFRLYYNIIYCFNRHMSQILLAENPIKCNSTDLLAGNCSFEYNTLVGIKKDMWTDPNGANYANDPNLFVADIFLAATFFIGTLAFLWIVISWLKLIFQWWTYPKKSADAIKWIKFSLIWLSIVIFSYTIVRLIQYFVAGKI